MSAPCKFELSILNHDETALIKTSHHPEIGDADRATLENLKSSLRKLRDKERTLGFQRRRISKGTAEPRGQSVSGTAEHSLHRKQVFVAALKRVNKEIARLQKFEARKELENWLGERLLFVEHSNSCARQMSQRPMKA